MNRREMLVRAVRFGAVLVALPAALELACAERPPHVLHAPEPAAVAPQTFVFTTSWVAGHEHRLVLASPAMRQPPPGGLAQRTGRAAGHYHVVALAEDELRAMWNGETVIRETSVVDGHAHTLRMNIQAR